MDELDLLTLGMNQCLVMDELHLSTSGVAGGRLVTDELDLGGVPELGTKRLDLGVSQRLGTHDLDLLRGSWQLGTYEVRARPLNLGGRGTYKDELNLSTSGGGSRPAPGNVRA